MAFLLRYLDPVLTACLLFVPAAAVFTLPFMVVQYRRYGSIPVLRVVVVYSFILYMMCSFFLTVLPLPDPEVLAASEGAGIQWIPFETYLIMFRRAGFSLADPATFLGTKHWLGLMHSRGLFEILANILMQIPLGIFLRYYFRLNRKQVILIGFLVSLFYEVTQLTGVFFLYSKAYRLCSVDDLIGNTLGAYIGYALTPMVTVMLPTRDRLDAIAMARGRKITYLRRIAAAAIDFLLFALLPGWYLLHGSDLTSFVLVTACAWFVWILVVYVLLQRMNYGQTLGKMLLKIRLVDTKTGSIPSMRQILIRYGLVYVILPLLMLLIGALMLLALNMVFDPDGGELRVIGLTIAFGLLIGCSSGLATILSAHHGFPHSYLSGTHITHDVFQI